MKKISFIFLLTSFLLVPFFVFAQNRSTVGCTPEQIRAGATGPCLQYTPLEPLPNETLSTNPNNPSGPNIYNGSFGDLIGLAIKTMLILGALGAVGSLVAGGVVYMTSEATGNKKAGLDRAQASVWGILLLAFSYLLLNTINPCLVSNANNCSQNTGTPAATPSSFSVTNNTPTTGTVSTGAVNNPCVDVFGRIGHLTASPGGGNACAYP